MIFYRKSLVCLIAVLALGRCSWVPPTPDDSVEPSYIADSSRGLFTGESAYDAATGTVDVGFSSQVRMRDGISGDRLEPGLEFETLVSDSESWPKDVSGQTSTLNSDGELQVEGAIRYQELANEKYFKKYLLIRATDGADKGRVRAVEIYLNPWQRGDLFYRDARSQGVPAFQTAETERAELVLPNYTAVFTDRDFRLDAHLVLTMVRRYAVTLKPGLVRKNAQGDTRPIALRPGTPFHVKGVVTDPNAPDVSSAFVAAFETDVEVDERGEISFHAGLAVRFTDLPRLDSRTRIHLTLAPRFSAGAKTATLSAAFVANPNGNDTSTGQTIVSEGPTQTPQVDASKLVRLDYPGGTAYATKLDWGGGTLDTFVKYWKGYGPLMPVSFDPQVSWAQSDKWAAQNNLQTSQTAALGAFIESDGHQASKLAPTLLKPFCSAAGVLASDRAACLARPETFFHLSHFTLVDQVLSEPEIADTRNPFIQLGTAYFNEIGTTDRIVEGDKQSQQTSTGSNSKLGYEIIGSGHSFSSSYARENEWYQVKEAALTSQARSRVSVQEQVILMREQLVFTMDLSLRKCALVRPVRFVQESQNPPVPSYLFCGRPTVKKKVKESWYVVRDRWNAVHSSFSDPKNPEERGWTRLVRGENAFNGFVKMITDPTKAYVFEKIDPFFDGVDSLAGKAFTSTQMHRLQRDGGIFPGVLSVSESSVFQWSLPQIEHQTELCIEGVESQTQNEAVLAQGARYCGCFYETAARTVSYEEYLQKPADCDRKLEMTGARDRCVRYAKAGVP